MANKSLYVRSNYQVNQTPQFKVLSSDQCEEAYLSALEVLERTGADIFSAEALNLFANGGCWVEGNRVRFPSHIVEMAVQTVPSRVVISNRKGERAIFLEGQNNFVGPSMGGNFVLDPISGERREFQKSDYQQTALVADALPNIDFVSGVGGCSFGDLVKNTTKPIIQKVNNVKQCEKILKIAAAVTGSSESVRRSPFFIFQIASTSPLSGSGEAMDQVIFAAQNRVPVIYATQAFSGDL
ncbi:MAG: trimethylamine methyltransferase family protein, partial [Dehalobacterium sp.]